MMLRSLLVGVAIAACATRPATAQVGRLDDRTEFAVITGVSVNNQHAPLVAVVLWRGPTGWSEQTGAARTRADSAYRWARSWADEHDLSFFGMPLAFGFVDHQYRSVSIEGTVYSIAPRDSALVIMVTVPETAAPRSVTTAHLASDAFPDAFWPKSWSSGDTTFIVRPRYPRDVQMLRDALLEAPAVRAFLR